MKLKKLLTLVLIISFAAFMACSDSSDEPNDEEAQQAVQSSMQELDQMTASMFSGSMSSALITFSTISQTLPVGLDFLPMLPSEGFSQKLFKSNFGEKFFEIQADSGLIALMGLHGTFTYVDGQWIPSDQPADELLIIFPFTNLSNGLEQMAQIRIFGGSLTDSQMQMTIAITVAGAPAATINISLLGSNFAGSEDAVITSASVDGNLVDETGQVYNFDLDLSDSQISLQLGPAGGSALTVTATGTGLIAGGLTGDPDQVPVNEVTMNYKDTRLVLDNLNAESGDVGDVYYKNNKIGDVVAEGDELYVDYSDGTRVNLNDMMPNTLGLVALVQGIGLTP